MQIGSEFSISTQRVQQMKKDRNETWKIKSETTKEVKWAILNFDCEYYLLLYFSKLATLFEQHKRN